jgi:hypothetical protein
VALGSGIICYGCTSTKCPSNMMAWVIRTEHVTRFELVLQRLGAWKWTTLIAFGAWKVDQTWGKISKICCCNGLFPLRSTTHFLCCCQHDEAKGGIEPKLASILRLCSWKVSIPCNPVQRYHIIYFAILVLNLTALIALSRLDYCIMFSDGVGRMIRLLCFSHTLKVAIFCDIYWSFR